MKTTRKKKIYNYNNQIFNKSPGPIKKFSVLEESENKLIDQKYNLLNINDNNIINIHNSNYSHNSLGISPINHRTTTETVHFSVNKNPKLNKFNLNFNFWKKLLMSRLCMRKSKISDFDMFLFDWFDNS
jgi:hypothetical protein